MKTGVASTGYRGVQSSHLRWGPRENRPCETNEQVSTLWCGSLCAPKCRPHLASSRSAAALLYGSRNPDRLNPSRLLVAGSLCLDVGEAAMLGLPGRGLSREITGETYKDDTGRARLGYAQQGETRVRWRFQVPSLGRPLSR